MSGLVLSILFATSWVHHCFWKDPLTIRFPSEPSEILQWPPIGHHGYIVFTSNSWSAIESFEYINYHHRSLSFIVHSRIPTKDRKVLHHCLAFIDLLFSSMLPSFLDGCYMTSRTLNRSRSPVPCSQRYSQDAVFLGSKRLLTKKSKKAARCAPPQLGDAGSVWIVHSKA